MNNQLIMKIIHSNDINACPKFTYENPLIDRNVAGALARSFMKILRVPQQDSNINNNLRHSVLANIRKLCRIEPENHLIVDENFTKLLSEVYEDSLRSSETNCIDQTLDEFLIRRIKEVDINSNYQCSINPDVAQALLNLSENNSYVESISKDVVRLDMSNKKNVTLVKNLWINSSLDNYVSSNFYDDMALKMRSEIELSLLNVCHRLLTKPNLHAEELFSANTLADLVKKCSKSPECFQICSNILNYLFIHTNYNVDIKKLVSEFIKNVRANCSNTISVLYPAHLSCIVVLLDIDLNTLHTIKSKYVERTLCHLNRLHEDSHCDFVLLMSHFLQWLPIYFES